MTPALSLSSSARLDVHSEYGTFFSPRVSALARSGAGRARVSVGTGFFASTPLTEETEAAGLTRLARRRAARSRARAQRVVRPVTHGWTVLVHGDVVRLAHQRSAPRRSIAVVRPQHSDGSDDERRPRAAGHVPPRAVLGHGDLHLRARARDRGRGRARRAADAAPQRGTRRHVGGRGRRAGRRRVVLHRRAAARRESRTGRSASRT